MPERVACGSLSDLPTDRAIAVADGRAVLVRIGDEVRAFENRCLHADQPLADGVISEGVLMCPHHFWRYDAVSGELTSSGPTADQPCLASFDLDVVDDELFVSLPPQQPKPGSAPGSIRDLLLDHARTWDRNTQARGQHDAASSNVDPNTVGPTSTDPTATSPTATSPTATDPTDTDPTQS